MIELNRSVGFYQTKGSAMGRRYKYKKLLAFMESGLLLVIETALFAYVWYSHYMYYIQIPFWRRGNYAVIGIYTLILFLFTKLYGGYRVGYLRLMDVLYSQVLSLVCSNIVLYFQLCIIGRDYMNPKWLLAMTGVEVIAIFVWVFLCKWLYAKIYPPRKMILIYGEELPQAFINKINSRKDKYNICDTVHIDEGIDVILEKISHYWNVVICDTPSSIRNVVMKYCFEKSIRTYTVPKVADIMILGSEQMHLFDTPLLLQRNQGLNGDQELLKRCMDIIGSLVMLVLASPIMLIIAIAIKCYDGGPVFYRQTRLTKDGKEFSIYKFRSMRVDSEKDGARLAMKGDSRVTPVGKVIRNLHFDEFPQIFNILKGDMSLVGPRPERPEINEQYKEYIPEFGFRLKVKAGLTGYAQVYGKYNTTPRDKLKLDLFYIEHYSIWLDIKVLLLTFKILFQKENTEGVDENQTTAIQEPSKTGNDMKDDE